METIFMLVIGFLVGALAVGAVFLSRKKESGRLKEELKDAFSSISLEALEKSAGQFLKLSHEVLNQKTSLASQELEGKKLLIERMLAKVEEKIREVAEQVHLTGKNQDLNLGLLKQRLEQHSAATERLTDTAAKLHSVLANSKKRGEWGERMAEDVLRLAGFQEGINYLKQKSVQAVEESRDRPDFTFLLPQDLKLNMDVKFPLDNYLKYLDAASDADRAGFRDQFLRDVRGRIREVTSRDYINSETVDYCLIFIPNEQVYSFIQSEEPTLLDEALKVRVVLSSPLTLYAILALIRQTVDNFNLGKTNREILSYLSAFRKQWEMFLSALERLGKKLEDAQKEYDSLRTTRRNQLERPLRKIEELRGGINAPAGEGEAVLIESEPIDEAISLTKT